MQKIHTILFVSITAVAMVCCSTKKTADIEQHAPSTEELSSAMDTYHELMAQSFHPFMDSGNLQPAKAHADDLAAAAARWADMSPTDDQDKALHLKLQELKTNSRAFAHLVREGNDEAIGKSLESLHRGFHGLMELWSNAPKDHLSK